MFHAPAHKACRHGVYVKSIPRDEDGMLFECSECGARIHTNPGRGAAWSPRKVPMTQDAHKAQNWLSPVMPMLPATFIGTKEIIAWPEERDPQPSREDPLGQLRRPGYAVKYPDGYTSWSPKAAFEAAYRVTEGADQALTFGDALHFIKQGRRVTRKDHSPAFIGLCSNWSGNVQPGAAQYALLPFLYVRHDNGDILPWTPTTEDLLAEDWMVL